MNNSKQQAIDYCKSKNYAPDSLEEGTAIDAYVTAYEQAEKDFVEKAEKYNRYKTDKKVTFMFDKYQNEVDLFRYDRTDVNPLGIGTEESIAKLVVLLAKHIKNMDNGKTLYVTFEENTL